MRIDRIEKSKHKQERVLVFLEVAYASQDYEAIRLTVEAVSRPGLQIAGYFDYFEPMRLQILGNVEVSYLQKKSSQGPRG